jgi:trehalose 6-phosphate phosphatase
VARALPGVRIICGAAAVNLLPAHGANKGVALRRALDVTGCQTAIYTGDDDTDEDAFSALKPERLLAIRVGASRKSHARYYIESQKSIDLLLRALIAARGL